MPRYVDSRPPHPAPLDKKVLVASWGRNGTMGVYTALNMLGYKSYHVIDIFKGGIPDLKMSTEAFEAAVGKGKKWTKEDYDKWLGSYDAITDITPCIADDMFKLYPDAKWILTYREPEAWLKSINNTIVAKAKQARSPTLWFLSFFDNRVWSMMKWQASIMNIMFAGHPLEDGQAAVRQYLEYNEHIKEMVPPERLLVVKLEDGLGWEKICEFLDKPVPDEPYPRINDTKMFQERAGGIMKNGLSVALTNFVAFVVTPTVAAGAWWFLRGPGRRYLDRA